MVFAQTDGIVSVLLDHTCTRGLNVARKRYFFIGPPQICNQFSCFDNRSTPPGDDVIYVQPQDLCDNFENKNMLGESALQVNFSM